LPTAGAAEKGGDGAPRRRAPQAHGAGAEGEARGQHRKAQEGRGAHQHGTGAQRAPHAGAEAGVRAEGGGGRSAQEGDGGGECVDCVEGWGGLEAQWGAHKETLLQEGSSSLGQHATTHTHTRIHTHTTCARTHARVSPARTDPHT